MNDPSKEATTRIADPDATLLPDGTVRAPDTLLLEPGATVARYTVIERVGAGAMGVVFSAWDPELDRRVALKLVQANDPSESARAALLREAKALARLSHPNVVTVYDVGTWCDALFIAMEYLHGETLAAWRESNPNASWTRVVGTYMHAGAGLAAAHEAGLIHRDFKPQNVVVNDSGDVKVLDFGLARTGDSAPASRAGTPRYMAPEQHGREVLDARCDQFSFCVALYEALFGQHPFGGGPAMQVALAIQAGELEPPPRDTSVPAGIRHAIMRGLSTDPDARFASMEALLTALDPDAAPRRRQRWLLGGSGVLVVGAAAFVSTTGDPPCGGVLEPLQGVWNADRRAAVAQRLTEGPVPAQQAEETLDRFDAFAQQWTAQRAQACEATKVTHAQTEATMELRYHCLDQSVDDFAVLVEKVEHATDSALLSLATTLETIPALERCADLELLRAEFPLPDDPETREALRSLRAKLGDLEAAFERPVADRAREFEALTAVADELGHPPVQVSSRHVLGSTLVFAGEVPRGLAVLEEAVQLGLRVGERRQTVVALLELARLRAEHLRELQSGLVLVRIAEAIAVSLPENDRILDRVHNVRLQIHRLAMDVEAAEAEARILLRRLDASGDLERPRGVEARLRLGFVLAMADKLDEAEAVLASVLDSPTIGDGHPLIARAYAYRARLRDGQQRYDEAIADHRAAFERYNALFGPNHTNTAGRLTDLAKTLFSANRLEEANETARRGIELTLVGHPDHADARLVVAYEQLALVELNLGDLEAADDALEQAGRWMEGLPESVSGDPGFADVARGRIAEERGSLDVARAAYARGLRIAPHEDDKVAARVGLALVSVLEGKLVGAQAQIDELRTHPELGALDAARLSYASALLEHARGQDATARRYLREARERLESTPSQRMLGRKLDALERTLSD